MEYVSESSTPEVMYLAVVQTGGLCEDGSVVSRGFADHLEAIRYVRDIVENTHGEAAIVVPSFTKLRYDFGGEPHAYERWMWTIISNGGPTWGMVIDNGESGEEELNAQQTK